MATIVEMGLPDNRGPYPQVKIKDREDARVFVDILRKNGIPVNLREVPDEPEHLVNIMETLTRTPVRRGGLRFGVDCIYCGHALHTINGGVCNVIISDIAGEVVLCKCEGNK